MFRVLTNAPSLAIWGHHVAAPLVAPGRRGAEGSHAISTRGWTDQDRWNTVAYLWSVAITLDQLDLGQRLFLKNCAACHEERGSGDGPGGKGQPTSQTQSGCGGRAGSLHGKDPSGRDAYQDVVLGEHPRRGGACRSRGLLLGILPGDTGTNRMLKNLFSPRLAQKGPDARRRTHLSMGTRRGARRT